MSIYFSDGLTFKSDSSHYKKLVSDAEFLIPVLGSKMLRLDQILFIYL